MSTRPTNQQVVLRCAVLRRQLGKGDLVAQLSDRQGAVGVHNVHAQPALLLLQASNLSLVSGVTKDEEVFIREGGKLRRSRIGDEPINSRHPTVATGATDKARSLVRTFLHHQIRGKPTSVQRGANLKLSLVIVQVGLEEPGVLIVQSQTSGPGSG